MVNPTENIQPPTRQSNQHVASDSDSVTVNLPVASEPTIGPTPNARQHRTYRKVRPREHEQMLELRNAG